MRHHDRSSVARISAYYGNQSSFVEFVEHVPTQSPTVPEPVEPFPHFAATTNLRVMPSYADDQSERDN